MRDLPVLAVLWVVLSALGEWVIQLLVDHWPLVASAQGEVTSGAFIFLFRVGAVVFIGVALAIAYAMIRWRVPDEDAVDSHHQYRSNWRFVAVWVVASSLLNGLFIVHPGITGLAELWGMAVAASNNPDTVEVDVKAKQWSWHFSYPKYGIFDATTLVLPVDVPVKFVLHSEDVIHSFWIPSFGIKKDVIPGETRVLFVTPDKITATQDNLLTRVQCAELCGSGHSTMRAVVQVESKSDFLSWAKKNGSGAAAPAPSGPGRGGA